MRIELKLVAFLSIHHRNLHGSPAVWQYKIVCNIAFVTLFVAGYYSFYAVRGLVTRLIFCSSFSSLLCVLFSEPITVLHTLCSRTQNDQLILFKINEKLRIAIQLFSAVSFIFQRSDLCIKMYFIHISLFVQSFEFRFMHGFK